MTRRLAGELGLPVEQVRTAMEADEDDCGPIAMTTGNVSGMTMRMMSTMNMKNIVMMTTIGMNGMNAPQSWGFPWPCPLASGSTPKRGHQRLPGSG